jgi:hypothetical protein
LDEKIGPAFKPEVYSEDLKPSLARLLAKRARDQAKRVEAELAKGVVLARCDPTPQQLRALAQQITRDAAERGRHNREVAARLRM